MYIECLTRRGTTSVNVNSDNLVPYGIFAAALLSSLPFSIITMLITLLVMILLVELAGWIRILRLGARRLHPSQAPSLARIIADEAGIMGVPRFTSPELSRVYYIPSAVEATAFTLSGFSPKLVVTGGLCVAASDSPEVTGTVIRHELAHVSNKDSRLWLVFGPSIFFCVLAFFPEPHYEIQETIKEMVTKLAVGLAGIAAMLMLFRRREFLADALTLNHTSNRELYCRLLGGRSIYKGGWFHPSRPDRLAALEFESPVLRINGQFLLVLLLITSANVAFVVSGLSHATSEDGGTFLLMVFPLIVVLCLFLFTIFMELRKGLRRKIPIAHGLSPESLPFRPLLSRLADVIGVGGPSIQWERICLYVLTGFLPLLVYELRCWSMPRVYGSSYPVEFVRDAVPVLLIGVATVVMLRVTRSVAEAAAVVATISTVYFVFIAYFRHSTIDVLDIPLQFLSVLLPLAGLGIALARFRSLFVGLFVGYMTTTLYYFLETLFRGAEVRSWSSWDSFVQSQLAFARLLPWWVFEALAFAALMLLAIRFGSSRDSAQHEVRRPLEQVDV